MQFVFVRSWHTIRLMGRGGRYITFCGRQAPDGAQTADELPAGRSCESCLRIVARRADG